MRMHFVAISTTRLSRKLFSSTRLGASLSRYIRGGGIKRKKKSGPKSIPPVSDSAALQNPALIRSPSSSSGGRGTIIARYAILSYPLKCVSKTIWRVLGLRVLTPSSTTLRWRVLALLRLVSARLCTLGGMTSSKIALEIFPHNFGGRLLSPDPPTFVAPAAAYFFRDILLAKLFSRLIILCPGKW